MSPVTGNCSIPSPAHANTPRSNVYVSFTASNRVQTGAIGIPSPAKGSTASRLVHPPMHSWIASPISSFRSVRPALVANLKSVTSGSLIELLAKPDTTGLYK